MTARLRAVTEATEVELLRTVASALVSEKPARMRINNVVRVGLERSLAEVDRALREAHQDASLGAAPGRRYLQLRDRVRRRVQRAFMAVLVDATRLHTRLVARELDPDELQAELDRAVSAREGSRVRVQDQWWTLTTYTQVVLGSGRKRAGIWGTVDRG